MMRDLLSPRLIVVKGVLFLLAGVAASALLIADSPTLRTASLLGVAVWCFARSYYCAFYVIEHWVDPSFRFSGLVAFAVYLARRRLPVDSQDPAPRRIRFALSSATPTGSSPPPS